MTTIPRGFLSTVLLGAETSYGTGGTANKDFGLVQNVTVNPDQSTAEQHGLGQSRAVYVKGGKVNGKGSIEAKLQHGRPLEYCIFGGTTTHVETTGDWVHTMVWSEELDTYAMEVSHEQGASDFVGAYVGVLFGSTTISSALDAELSLRSDFTWKDVDLSGTTATAAVVNTGAPLRGFECGLEIAGSNIDYVQSWELTVNKNSKVFHGMGGRESVDGSSHHTNTDWRATIGLSDTTQLARLTGAAAGITATEVTSFTTTVKADNGIALGSGKRRMAFNLVGCQVKDWSIAARFDDFVVYDISGSGIISSCSFTDQVTSANW